MENIFLSVIIPCYNEERNLRLGALENVAHFLKKKNLRFEVIIVDDGSRDESRKLIRDFITDHDRFRLLERNHQGKAGTVLAGIREAQGDYILFTDLDQATPINQLDVLLPVFKRGADVVIGSRNSMRRGAPLTRKAMAKGFMFLRNLILDLGIRDTQCGFKMFTKSAARKISSRMQLYGSKKEIHGSTVTAGFDVELLYIAKTLGLKIAEVPVEWHYQETRHVSPLKDSWEGLMDLLAIRLNSLQGKYSLSGESIKKKIS